MSNIRKYRLVAGVHVDLDTGDVVKGYYVEKAVLEGDRITSYFVPGNIDSAIQHIRRTHGIIDTARLAKISKFLDELVPDMDETEGEGK